MCYGDTAGKHSGGYQGPRKNNQRLDKQIWNESLKAFIKVKFVSINETYSHAARRYESTVAVFNLTEILSNAKLIAKRPKKDKDKNQRPYSQILLLKWHNIRLVVGLQRTTGEYIQYCITVEDEIK